MRAALLVILLACAFGANAATPDKPVHATSCGVTFRLTAGWTDTIQAPDKDSAELRACDIVLRPRHWLTIARKSRWGAPKDPLLLVVFKEGTSMDDALDDMGFEHEDERFGVPGGYGSFGEAEKVTDGPFQGLDAASFFRGFISDEARLRDGESRVWSGEIVRTVLKSPHGRIIGFECNGGTPDEAIDCRSVMKRVTRTFRVLR